MKLLLLPLLLLAGAGGYGLASGAPQSSAEARTDDCDDCRITVECTDRGTCIVTCTDADGEVRCRQEIECDEACEKACDEPCLPSKSCAR